jgi:molecular chaperone GrpE
MSHASLPASLEQTPASSVGRRLTPEQVESILADFRRWLIELVDAVPPVEPPPAISWSHWIEHLVALRHEVQLQTRALRQQTEQMHQILQQLVQVKSASPPDPGKSFSVESLRPVLESLIEMADVHERAVGEMARILGAWETSAPVPSTAAPVVERRRRWWHRWVFGQRSANPAVTDAIETSCGTLTTGPSGAKERWAALADGLRRGSERLARILRRHGLEPIPTVGLPFDPETMEAIDVVSTGTCPRGQVVAEFRRGYRWNGQLFRAAQVQVNQGVASPAEDRP